MEKVRKDRAGVIWKIFIDSFFVGDLLGNELLLVRQRTEKGCLKGMIEMIRLRKF